MENPRRDYRILGLYHEREFVGCSVYRLYRSLENNQTEASILDWFGKGGVVTPQGGKPEYGKILLQETVEYLVRKGACMIRVTASGEYSPKAVSGLDFSRRPEGPPFFVYCSQAELRHRLLDGKSWFLTEGDQDTDGF